MITNKSSAANIKAESYKGIDIISPKLFAIKAGRGYPASNKDTGIFGILPQTINTAIVSPKALETAKTIAAIIPGVAFFKITCWIVSNFVAPSDKETARNSLGIVWSTSTIILTIIGKIITASTIPPENTEYPLLLIPKIGAIWFPISGTTNSTPHTPYKTGGIAAKI